MRNLFQPDKGLWRVLGWLGDGLMLSMLWTVFSAPVLSAGAASAALYDAVTAGVYRGETATLARFFSTFRRELRASLAPTVLWAAALGLLFWAWRTLLGGLSGRGGVLIAAGTATVLLIPLGAAGWVFPLLSRFTLDFRTLNANAVRLALGHLPRTLLIGLLTAGAGWVTLRLALLPLFLAPALLALAWSVLMEPVFRSYEE